MLVFWRWSHHSLSGRLLRHHHTSYALLLFVTLIAGGLLASVTWSAYGCGRPLEPVCEASYAVQAVVTEPRPTTPAIITSPKTGQTFNTNPVVVEGTCPDKALIKVFTNGILVGSVFCERGRFRVPVDLVIGRNDL